MVVILKKFLSAILSTALIFSFCFLSGCSKAEYLTAKQYYFINDEIANTKLYEKASESSKVLGEDLQYLYVLEEKDGWAYGSWGNLFGYIKAENIKDNKNSVMLPLPEFLNAEQKSQFLRATGIFDAYIAHNWGLNTISSSETIDNSQAIHDVAFTTYSDFDKAIHELFTQKYLDGIKYKYYFENNGKLYVHEGDRGSFGAEIENYSLKEKAKDRIAFDVNFLFKTKVSEHRCSLPIVMVKENSGWRFDDFTSGADDTRWMEKMGEDFDPWEGVE